MQTSDIEKLFKHFPLVNSHFKGVFAIDLIPRRLPKRYFFIFNKDPSTRNGSHWLTCIHLDQNKYEIFDSLGTDYEFLKPYLKFPEAEYSYNSAKFQDNESSTCGLFASYYAIHQILNIDLSMDELLREIFEINVKTNEKNVLDFFSYFLK
jgi:hypothetical protein